MSAANQEQQCAVNVGQLYDIYNEGDFEYPLKQNQYLMDVKYGNRDFEEVLNTLEQVFDDIISLSAKTLLPENVDIQEWNDFVKNTYYDIVIHS